MTIGRTSTLFLIGWALACQPPRSPKDQPARMRLLPEFTIGTIGDGPDGFGDVRGFVVDRQNQLWVVDGQAQELRVFDSAGRFLRKVGRKGSGPGEFVYADGITATPNGRVWVHDPQNSRLSAFDPDGRFIEQILAPTGGYGYVWEGGVDSSGRVWEDFITVDTVAQQPVKRFRRYAPDFSRADTVELPACVPGPGRTKRNALSGTHGFAQIPNAPGAISATDFNGRMACIPWTAEPNGYAVDLSGTDTLTRYAVEAAPIALRPLERDSVIASLGATAKKIGADFSPSTVPATKPAVHGMFFDGEGRLWIKRITPAGGTEFDIFDRAGRLVTVVESPFDPSNYIRPMFRGDRIYFFVPGTDDVPQIVRTQLVPVAASGPPQ